MTVPEERTRRPEYVTLIAIYHLLMGGLALLGALAIVVFGMLPILFAVQEAMPLAISLAALAFGVVLVGILAVASLAVGYGLLRMQNWARWGAIILAVLMLPGFPVSTVIGVLILIYLLGDEGRRVFEG
ncbi:MAG: hypothetical protein ACYC5M_13925 [Anaerolineae bacterium]